MSQLPHTHTHTHTHTIFVNASGPWDIPVSSGVPPIKVVGVVMEIFYVLAKCFQLELICQWLGEVGWNCSDDGGSSISPCSSSNLLSYIWKLFYEMQKYLKCIQRVPCIWTLHMCFESTVTSPLCESNKASLGTQPTQWLCSTTILQSVCSACELSCFSCVRLWATLWTVACQAPLSMGFSRQEYWSGLPCPPPRDLRHPGTEPTSLISAALGAGFFTSSATLEDQSVYSTFDTNNT